MDGDTALGHDILEKSLPIFRLQPNVGGVTTNNHALVSNNCAEIIRDWYNLKMVKRHHMMSAHAVSNRVLTMTGRFSVFRAAIALSTEFITNLEEDYVDDWLHGRIAFLMGDDKSTMSYLLKYNWDCSYVPDTYAICLEDRTGNFFDIANTLMLRWYGNMLRVNGKSICEGLTKMPFFTWVAFIDQRISMWTTLIGPVTAVLMSVCVSGYYLIFYALWVILTRWGQLVVTCGFHGHTLKITDLPLQVFEQWYGALVKIYCQFHLHKQLWQKSRAEAQVISTGEKLGDIIAKCLMGFYFALFALFILFCTKLVKLPGLF
jgi:glycosyltransferase Alg8